jgi:tetratricopeptide (TPR) repeat protein/tRNA A-37 threonylcarbamoyl transferase component Bud32
MNDRWERLIDLYHSAVSLPADERATLLAEECGDDLTLQADVERMIVAHHRVSRPTGAAPVVDAPPLRPHDTTEAASGVDSAPPPPEGDEPASIGAVRDALEGEPIEAYADNHQLSVTERLELFLQLCNAVANAHRRGLAHGALAPGDILVTAAGAPLLPDAGLGDDDPTPAADVTALGVVLDRLLAVGVTTAHRRPLRRQVDGTVLKALRRDGQWRYESVEALADDIRRQLETAPARERRDARRTRPATPSRRRVSAVAAWSLAAVAVVALGALAWPLRQRRAESAPVTPQTETRPLRTRVLVGDLADHAQDPQLAAALSDALRAGLAESPSIGVATARQGTGAELTGSIERTAGAGYTLTVQLTTSRDSAGPRTLHETALDSSDVIPALGRLSQQLREQFGESPTSIAATPRLEDVTTASLPALRAFASGASAIRSGDRAGGIRSLVAAVALDSGYASAYHLLGLTYRGLDDRLRSGEAMDHAITNRARLPFTERNQTIASQAMTVTGDYASAVDAYNRLLSRDPRNARILASLGAAHAARREYAVQESLLVRAIAVDSDVSPLHIALAMAQVNQGKYDDARRALDRTEGKFPGLRSAQLARVAFAASQRDWETAEREVRDVVSRVPSDSIDALDTRHTLGNILMAQGRLGEAEQEFRRIIALGARRGAARPSYAATLSLAYLELRYRHSPAAAVSAVNGTLARLPLGRLDPEDRPYEEIARLFANAGQPARAAGVMAQATRAGARPGADANRRWAAGAIAMAERRAWEGEIEIQTAANTHQCPICALPDLARAYEVAGKPDSASAIYEQYLRAPWHRRYDIDGVELGFAMKRLGELYQQQNDRSRAAAQYTALLELWRGADRELGPLVADVRRRLEQTTDVSAAR